MQHTAFAVTNTSITDEKERIKIELLGDPDNAARCMLRITYEDGSVFETIFNRNGGQVSQTRRDEKGNDVPLNPEVSDETQAVTGGASVGLDPADVRNPASRAANDKVNTTAGMANHGENSDHNQGLAKAALASGGSAAAFPDSQGTQPGSTGSTIPGGPRKSFRGPQVPEREKPRPDQGKEPFPPSPDVPVDHNQALGATDSGREASAKAGVPVRRGDEDQGADHSQARNDENRNQRDTRKGFAKGEAPEKPDFSDLKADDDTGHD